MSKITSYLILTLGCIFVAANYMSNVRLVNHREYLREVFHEMVKILEERQWCNLKVPEFEMEVNDVVLDWQINGTVLFQNGFTVSIQRLDVVDTSIGQSWTWNNDDGSGTVELKGPFRMHNLVVGFDVVANFNGNVYRSTATILHPMITFEFSIFRNTLTGVFTGTVDVFHPKTLQKLDFLPSSNATSVIRALYDTNSTFYGITSWGPEVLLPIVLDVVTNRLEFPETCYNCPIA